MMAGLGAFTSWQDKISQHRVVLFTDSEAVGGSFLKSWSANEDSDRLMGMIFDIEGVPSQTNPADVLPTKVVTAQDSGS